MAEECRSIQLAERESEKVSLFDVLEEGRNIPPLVEGTKRRLQNLHESLQYVKDPHLREVISNEKERAEQSLKDIEDRLAQIGKRLKAIKIQAAGRTMTVLQVYELVNQLMVNITKLRQGLGHARPVSFGHSQLEVAADGLVSAYRNAIAVYSHMFQGVIAALRSFYIEPGDMTVLSLLWNTAQNARTVTYIWNAKEEMWEPPEDLVENEYLRRTLGQLSQATVDQGGRPDGARLNVHAHQTPDGVWIVGYGED